jgi:hypothetical protein
MLMAHRQDAFTLGEVHAKEGHYYLWARLRDVSLDDLYNYTACEYSHINLNEWNAGRDPRLDDLLFE